MSDKSILLRERYIRLSAYIYHLNGEVNCFPDHPSKKINLCSIAFIVSSTKVNFNKERGLKTSNSIIIAVRKTISLYRFQNDLY